MALRRLPVFERWLVGGVAIVTPADRPDAATRLEGTAAALWIELAETDDLDEIVARLAATYQADPETVRADVGVAVHDLEDRGILRVDS